jgi:hypothetical protein
MVSRHYRLFFLHKAENILSGLARPMFTQSRKTLGAEIKLGSNPLDKSHFWRNQHLIMLMINASKWARVGRNKGVRFASPR